MLLVVLVIAISVGALIVQKQTIFKQVGSDLNGEGFLDSFATRVALSSDGTRVAICAPDNDGNGVVNAGHVRVYDVLAKPRVHGRPSDVPVVLLQNAKES